MNISLYEHDKYQITGEDHPASGAITTRLRTLTLEHPLYEWQLVIHLTDERVAAIRAILDRIYPPTPEPFVAQPERDAAPTLASELRPPGISACSATADAPKPGTIDELLAPVHDALAAHAHAKTMDFIARKLGLPL